MQLDARRLDSPGHYAVTGTVTPRDIQATVKADEPAKGLISGIAHLPDLGAIAIQASVNGPRDALATQLGINAGPLTASASGTVDLEHEAADLAVKAQAPAMTPAPACPGSRFWWTPRCTGRSPSRTPTAPSGSTP